MSKRGRVFVITIGLIMQVLLFVLYGFFNAPVSDMGCFMIWCGCAYVVYHFTGKCGMI